MAANGTPQMTSELWRDDVKPHPLSSDEIGTGARSPEINADGDVHYCAARASARERSSLPVRCQNVGVPEGVSGRCFSSPQPPAPDQPRPCSSAAIRFSVGGWLLKSEPILPMEKGLMMNMCAVAGLASIGIARDAASIFRSALTRPCGLPAIAAPPASAANSRDREIAI